MANTNSLCFISQATVGMLLYLFLPVEKGLALSTFPDLSEDWSYLKFENLLVGACHVATDLKSIAIDQLIVK